MLLPSGNPFKCHEEVLYFQLLIPPKKKFPLTGGCSEGLGAFRFFFKQIYLDSATLDLIAVFMSIYLSQETVAFL